MKKDSCGKVNGTIDFPHRECGLPSINICLAPGEYFVGHDKNSCAKVNNIVDLPHHERGPRSF
jgi:hypothetical protein